MGSRPREGPPSAAQGNLPNSGTGQPSRTQQHSHAGLSPEHHPALWLVFRPNTGLFGLSFEQPPNRQFRGEHPMLHVHLSVLGVNACDRGTDSAPWHKIPCFHLSASCCADSTNAPGV